MKLPRKVIRILLLAIALMALEATLYSLGGFSVWRTIAQIRHTRDEAQRIEEMRQRMAEDAARDKWRNFPRMTPEERRAHEERAASGIPDPLDRELALLSLEHPSAPPPGSPPNYRQILVDAKSAVQKGRAAFDQTYEAIIYLDEPLDPAKKELLRRTWADAEVAWRSAIEQLRATQLHDSTSVANIRLDLALVLHLLDRDEDAARELRRAVLTYASHREKTGVSSILLPGIVRAYVQLQHRCGITIAESREDLAEVERMSGMEAQIWQALMVTRDFDEAKWRAWLSR